LRRKGVQLEEEGKIPPHRAEKRCKSMRGRKGWCDVMSLVTGNYSRVDPNISVMSPVLQGTRSYVGLNQIFLESTGGTVEVGTGPY
jgi:hypothetical protein